MGFVDRETRMSFAFCVLASGSAGNCTLLQFGDGVDHPRRNILVDAGLSPRATARALHPLGVRPEDLTHILLTHFDSDHFHPGWIKVLGERRVPAMLMIHHHHRNTAWSLGLTTRFVTTFKDPFDLQQTSVHPMLQAHDALGSVSYVIEHDGRRLGYATDLGHVSDSLLDHFQNLHALAIESNYDRQMQLASPRPGFLKDRIMGGAGHLSNEQCLDAVLHIESRSALSHIALLHLSRECNCPKHLRMIYTRRAAHLLDRLTITSQSTPTTLLPVQPWPHARLVEHKPLQHQMRLFAGT